MTFLHALILGAVEGVTEFLPISSTAHLLLSGQLMGLEQTTFLKSFDIAIQLGAILAIVLLYAKRVLTSPAVMLRIVVAFIPTAILGAILHRVVKDVLFSSTEAILAVLLLGGVAIIVFEWMHEEPKGAHKDMEDIPLTTAALIGVFQAVAMVPGVSRAAATIVGGLLLGTSRKAIVEFSFLLAIPTMLAATVLDLWKDGAAFAGNEWTLLGVGFAAAFVTALLTVRWLVGFIRGHKFSAFGWYRIVAAIAAWFVLFGA